MFNVLPPLVAAPKVNIINNMFEKNKIPDAQNGENASRCDLLIAMK